MSMQWFERTDDAVSEIAEAAGVSPAPAKPSMSAPRLVLRCSALVVVVALKVLLFAGDFASQQAHMRRTSVVTSCNARQCALITDHRWHGARRMCATFWTALSEF